MNSKQPLIRLKGQRSIPSTFIFRRSNELVKEAEIKRNEKGSRISLSDFLNKKLNGGSMLHGSVQGKAQPFSSPVADRLMDKGNKDETVEIDKGEGNISSSPSFAVVLEQFKKTECEVKDNISLRENENRSATTNGTDRSRKRKQGDVASQPPRTVLAVLGDDAGADRRAKARQHGIGKKSRPLYNHYSNGGGWWDCDMEGVDNEEVGCNDVWEGMGTTNLGGLDWN
ncbi:hypothetical protein LIER_28120 [Lithospermum erythrorhizon]|uniref:Uncharacterized protein n=1 Tax=Lithospermum erythrorhizon TaxID=34254 RepID=A0AAV3RET7_LITER